MDSPDLSDTTTMTPEASDAGTAVSASEQARLRRERRKAKVGQGADRLKKITQTQKGPGFDTSYADDAPPIAKITPSTRNTNDHDDPPEIDISQHYFKPNTTPRPMNGSGFDTPNSMNDSPGDMMFNDPSSPFSMADLQKQQAQFQQLMMGNPMFNNQQQQSQAQGPFGGMGMGMPMGGGNGTPGQDPMMDMLQQMLGQFSGEGAGGPGLGGPGGADNPLAGMLSAMGGMGGMGGMPGMMGGQTTQVQPPQDVYGRWWKLLHAVCAMGLAMYAVWTMGGGFNGTKRMRALSGVEDKIPLFWYFTTMELLLQSTRFILEKGRPPPNSILSLIGSYLPPPFGSILLTLARYSVIWTTIWRDFLMLLFVLGICSWWNA